MVRAGKTPQICKGNGDKENLVLDSLPEQGLFSLREDFTKLHHPPGACVVVLRASLGRPLSVKSSRAKAFMIE